MKDDPEQNGGTLVASASRALTRNSNELVSRGLDDLLNEQSRIDSSDAAVNERKVVRSEQRSGEFQFDNPDEANQTQYLNMKSNVFDDETYAKAKPYFIAEVAHFNRPGMSANDCLRALMRHLAKVGGFSREKMTSMRPYLIRFTEELHAGKIDLSLTQEEEDLSREMGAERETESASETTLDSLR